MLPAEPTALTPAGRLRRVGACAVLTGLSHLYMNVGPNLYMKALYYTARAQYKGVLGKGAQGAARRRTVVLCPAGACVWYSPGDRLIRLDLNSRQAV